MDPLCDLCGNAALEIAYKPAPSPRGLTIHMCTRCGLVQSLPRIDRAPRVSPTVSGGADWGNLRYGKGFRAKPNLAFLNEAISLKLPLEVLDVGANRGAFAKLLLGEMPFAHITAVEPDERLPVPEHARIAWLPLRIEEAELADASFDLIYSSHTLEHVQSPLAVLDLHWRHLKLGGHLLLEVPNIALIASDDILEEWFIDKHLYHFSKATLTRALSAAGFRIKAGPSKEDREFLTVLAEKAANSPRLNHADPQAVEEARSLLAIYQANRTRNRASLKLAARTIAAMPAPIAIWGAGRLFNCLVTEGGLDIGSLGASVVDAHMTAYIDKTAGIPIGKPADLKESQPATIIVMSRGFAAEIAGEAKALVPDARLVFFQELLAPETSAA